MKLASAKDLDVYQAAFRLATDVFRVSGGFPPQERYSLTDQVRRSSRSVCANLREAWAKRRYPAHFVSKLSDCDGENAETDTWLDFAAAAGYLDAAVHGRLSDQCAAVGRMLGQMLKCPEAFILRPSADGSRRTEDRSRTSEVGCRLIRPLTADLGLPTSDLSL